MNKFHKRYVHSRRFEFIVFFILFFFFHLLVSKLQSNITLRTNNEHGDVPNEPKRLLCFFFCGIFRIRYFYASTHRAIGMFKGNESVLLEQTSFFRLLLVLYSVLEWRSREMKNH